MNFEAPPGAKLRAVQSDSTESSCWNAAVYAGAACGCGLCLTSVEAGLHTGVLPPKCAPARREDWTGQMVGIGTGSWCFANLLRPRACRGRGGMVLASESSTALKAVASV